MQPIDILRTYWGFKSFRPLQEEIINSVISKKDTLGILPTGGGKSICFQIPGLFFEGITLIVSPLIALMNDQVEILKKYHISALAFHSGITQREADIEYSNIRNGKYKMVYVSPERIRSERFKDAIVETPIKLIAVDEAHCISQWGFDFRPDYLLLSELRELLPNIPCVAITASATPQVVEDINKFLFFGKPANVFRQATFRPNLNYVVLQDENKNARLLKIVTKVKGSGLVYTKNRKSTLRLAKFLNENGIVADFYHAGLTVEERNQKQDSWKKGFTRVIICTNAFGMGIDKSNVRFVAHYDIPDSVEAYYQESGRAGRDGEESWCILMYCKPDRSAAELQLDSKYLDRKKIQQFFNALCSHCQIPYNGGLDECFEINVVELASKYKLQLPEIQSALNMLEKEGVLKLSEAYANPPRLRIVSDNLGLYKFYLNNPSYEVFIKTILRMYGGVFDEYVQISEFEISKNLTLSVDRVKLGLKRLTENQLFDYLPQSEKPTFSLLIPRQVDVPYDTQRWKFLKQESSRRLKAAFDYAESHKCRQSEIAAYFGESPNELCGKCDVCRNKRKSLGESINQVSELLKTNFNQNYFSLEQILNKVGSDSFNLEAFRFIMDSGQLDKNKDGLFKWK